MTTDTTIILSNHKTGDEMASIAFRAAHSDYVLSTNGGPIGLPRSFEAEGQYDPIGSIFGVDGPSVERVIATHALARRCALEAVRQGAIEVTDPLPGDLEALAEIDGDESDFADWYRETLAAALA